MRYCNLNIPGLIVGSLNQTSKKRGIAMFKNIWPWNSPRRGKGYRGGQEFWETPTRGPLPTPPARGIPLERVPPGTRVRVVAILAGYSATSRAFQMGIAPGSIIEVVENNLMYPWSPLLVKVHGIIVAVGRGLASKIIVEVLPEKKGEGITAQPEKSGIPEEQE